MWKDAIAMLICFRPELHTFTDFRPHRFFSELIVFWFFFNFFCFCAMRYTKLAISLAFERM